MGFTKWLLKNGSGSPGQTAKVWTEQFLKAPLGTPTGEILENLVMSFQIGQKSVGNLQYTSEPKKLVERCEECLATLIFFLLCDTKGFVKNIIAAERNFDLVTDSIFETVESIAPQAINFSLEDYKYMCRQYLNLSRFSHNVIN